MLTVKFDYDISDEVTIFVKASCVDVDSYEVTELQLKCFDKNGERVSPFYDRETFEEIETIAFEKLYEEKYNKELFFG